MGSGSLSDVLNFEVQANAARASRISAENSYALSRLGLASLLGLPEGALPAETEIAPLPEECLEEMQEPQAEERISYALEHRPDLHQSAYAVERADATVKASRAPFYPTVSVSLSQAASTTERKPDMNDFATSVGLNVSYSLYAGGRNKALLMEAKSAKREAEFQWSDAQIGVVSDVRQQIENVLAAQKQLALQRANAVFVQKNRDLVEKEYNAGQTSLVRLNEAQRDLTSAQGQLAQARVALRQAWHDLRTAMGATLETCTEEN